MSILPEQKRCPACGLTLLEHAELREAIPRKVEQAKLLEGLKQFVERYAAHNNGLAKSLSKSRVGGSFIRGGHRFNPDP
jgi:hypothetical protein